MSKQTLAHEYLEWSKQKLGEIEATLASLDSSVEALKSDARKEADRAIARIRTARDAFKAKVDALRSDAAATKAITDDAYAVIEAEWNLCHQPEEVHRMSWALRQPAMRGCLSGR